MFQRESTVWRALLALCVLLLGCETKLPVPETVTENSAQVSGTVTIKGSPLTSGQIMLYSLSNGNSVSAPLNNKGEFTLPEKIPAVSYTVFFSGPNGGGHTGVPEKYQSETSSDYSVSVVPGENQVDIAIK